MGKLTDITKNIGDVVAKKGTDMVKDRINMAKGTLMSHPLVSSMMMAKDFLKDISKSRDNTTSVLNDNDSDEDFATEDGQTETNSSLANISQNIEELKTAFMLANDISAEDLQDNEELKAILNDLVQAQLESNNIAEQAALEARENATEARRRNAKMPKALPSPSGKGSSDKNGSESGSGGLLEVLGGAAGAGLLGWMKGTKVGQKVVGGIDKAKAMPKNALAKVGEKGKGLAKSTSSVVKSGATKVIGGTKNAVGSTMKAASSLNIGNTAGKVLGGVGKAASKLFLPLTAVMTATDAIGAGMDEYKKSGSILSSIGAGAKGIGDSVLGLGDMAYQAVTGKEDAKMSTDIGGWLGGKAFDAVDGISSWWNGGDEKSKPAEENKKPKIDMKASPAEENKPTIISWGSGSSSDYYPMDDGTTIKYDYSPDQKYKWTEQDIKDKYEKYKKGQEIKLGSAYIPEDDEHLNPINKPSVSAIPPPLPTDDKVKITVTPTGKEGPALSKNEMTSEEARLAELEQTSSTRSIPEVKTKTTTETAGSDISTVKAQHDEAVSDDIVDMMVESMKTINNPKASNEEKNAAQKTFSNLAKDYPKAFDKAMNIIEKDNKPKVKAKTTTETAGSDMSTMKAQHDEAVSDDIVDMIVEALTTLDSKKATGEQKAAASKTMSNLSERYPKAYDKAFEKYYKEPSITSKSATANAGSDMSAVNADSTVTKTNTTTLNSENVKQNSKSEMLMRELNEKENETTNIEKQKEVERKKEIRTIQSSAKGGATNITTNRTSNTVVAQNGSNDDPSFNRINSTQLGFV